MHTSIRERFPTLRNNVYFNSGSYGALSVDVRDACNEYLSDRERDGACWPAWMKKYEEVRGEIAGLLGATPAEIAIGSSLSQCLNALVSALRFDGDRNRIVVTDFDFPTTAQIWHAQKRRGAEVVRVRAANDGKTIPLERFEQAIDDRTMLVSIPHVCYRNGSMLDIGAIVEIARRHDVLVYVDAYQSVGTRVVDPGQLAADFLSGGCTKYLLGSTGTAFLYIRRALIQKLAPLQSGWFAQADVNAMAIRDNDPAADARRFESGTPCIPSFYAASAGLGIIREVGLERIEARIESLTGDILTRARAAHYAVSTPVDPGSYGPLIALKSSDMHRLVGLLGEERIITSCRDGNIRISTHFYNSTDDVERLFEVLARHSELLVRC